MEPFAAVEKNLTARGFQVKTFATGAEAAAYLNGAIDSRTVGFGGSVTLDKLGLFDSLGQHNTVYWHWKQEADSARAAAAQAEVYLTSANGLAETGEVINLDGAGNRVAGTLYGHQKVYFVVGRNKLAPTYDEALWRARNIAAPKNAQRLGRKTPCAIHGDRCYDCKSPERICRGLVVLYGPMTGTETEIVLVDEELGF
jgi:NAD-dependent dihydropyrimidine dehydrogenase PreA subunit